MCIINKTCDDSLCNARIALQINTQKLLAANNGEESPPPPPLPPTTSTFAKDAIGNDALAISTIYTKIWLNKFNNALELFKNSIFYKILCNTTQPAHLLTILAVTTIAYFLYPNSVSNDHKQHSKLSMFFYIGSYCIHFGTQIWMTFVSGLALYFALPRHIFGSVQKVLFPKYFALNSLLSLITATVFLKNNNTSLMKFDVALQATTLSACFFIELLIRLYLTPPLIKLITKKNDLEVRAGVGSEVGVHNPGELINDTNYVKVHKTFRKVHMTIAIGNIITLACSVFHLHYITGKIQFV